jgi:hypothetical protein
MHNQLSCVCNLHVLQTFQEESRVRKVCVTHLYLSATLSKRICRLKINQRLSKKCHVSRAWTLCGSENTDVSDEYIASVFGLQKWAEEDTSTSRRRLIRAVGSSQWHGVTTNKSALVTVTAVKTSNPSCLTSSHVFLHERMRKWNTGSQFALCSSALRDVFHMCAFIVRCIQSVAQ